MKGITFFLLLVTFSTLHSQPVTLRDTTNQYDYIIITVPEFLTACEPFRQHKETVRDFRTLVIDTTQIFAEFDSSATPQDNIRDFISYAGTFWKESRPKYFLIVGTVLMVPNFPIPFLPGPIYFYSDYYYCQNIYENDTTTTDFYIGRIPGKNETEVTNYFLKVISYESDDSLLSWINNALFLCAGDGIQNLEFAFELASLLPSYIKPFYIAENDTSQYYGTLDSIYQAINQKGNSVVWLFGLSDDPYIGGSDWLKPEDLNGFSNEDKYFYTISSGRQRAILDTNTNLSHAMLVLPNAGSIGGSVFVGYTYSSINREFQINWASRLFNPLYNSIGEVFVSDNLPFNGLYNYVRKVANLWADPSLKLKYDETVGVEKVEEEIPQSFTLYQNYPNPFNPSTTIKFALPVDSKVKINVFNSLGQLVETLMDKEMESGYHEVSFNASKLASGVYLYQMQAGENVSIKKMILLK
ncbi:MAG: T9SS type A sorting domain-containing protein [Ignavibacteriaceae bacterium]|nr:T9SS type A sorting domain-containing protein [Ignavibacteriaceae bacterium]